MRIAMLLTNACAPDPRVEKEAQALAEAGHEVTILAWDRLGEAPEREETRGFVIERLGPRAPYGGGLKSLPLFSEFWKNAGRRALELTPDAVHCHDTDTIPAGMTVVNERPEVRLVADFHELYGESNMVPRRGVAAAVARRFVDRIERRGVARAAFVVVANPGTALHYEGIGAKGKLVVVENAPDAELFRPLPCDEPHEGLQVTFIGRKRYARTLEALMEACAELPGTSLLLAGSGPDAERIEASAAKYGNVKVEGHVPYARIPERYACADVVYAAYDTAVGNVLYTMPGKVPEAMGCGKPVIVSSGTWIGDYVTEQKVGVAVDSTDPGAIRSALELLAADDRSRREMGETGRRLVEEGLNWKAASGRLIAAYTQLV